MKFLTLSLCFLQITFNNLYAEVSCGASQDRLPALIIEKLAGQISQIAEKSSDDNKVKYEAASTYLLSIKDQTSFDEKVASDFIASLTPICENEAIELKFRSKVCGKLSGLHGKLAQKLQLSGVGNGQDAYRYLKIALNLDPDNTEAIVGHAIAIVKIYEQGFFIRKLAESKLNIIASQEAQVAKINLERMNLTKNPVYSKILEVL